VFQIDQDQGNQMWEETDRKESCNQPGFKHRLQGVPRQDRESPEMICELTFESSVVSLIDGHSTPWLSGKCPEVNRVCSPTGESGWRVSRPVHKDSVSRRVRAGPS